MLSQITLVYNLRSQYISNDLLRCYKSIVRKVAIFFFKRSFLLFRKDEEIKEYAKRVQTEFPNNEMANQIQNIKI